MQGRCIAGKELVADGFGQWIRPISNLEHEELLSNHVRCQDGQSPKLLDIITIPLRSYIPHDYQTENHLIDDTKSWVRQGALDLTSLPGLCDASDALWANGYRSSYGVNDRIPLNIAEADVRSSLLLITPSRLTISVTPEYNNPRKVRAKFHYNGTVYWLAVTDPTIENVFREKGQGEHPINRRDTFMCISLGEPYNGFAYKLVASIINAL
jgi:hypothetical protein